MPRKPADLRISINGRGGRTHRIELIRQPFGQKFWVRRDGKISEALPEATASELFALAYNLANFLRRLAVPKSVSRWTLTTLREKLIKIGAKVS